MGIEKKSQALMDCRSLIRGAFVELDKAFKRLVCFDESSDVALWGAGYE